MDSCDLRLSECLVEFFVYYLFPVWPYTANSLRQINVKRNGEHDLCRIGFPLLSVLIALENTWNYLVGGPRLIEPLLIQFNRIGIGCYSSIFGSIFPIFTSNFLKGFTPGIYRCSLTLTSREFALRKLVMRTSIARLVKTTT